LTSQSATRRRRKISFRHNDIVVVPAGIKLILKSQIMSKSARISSFRHRGSTTTKKISGESMWRQVYFKVFDPCREIGR